MRISAKDCGFEQYNEVADIEVVINVYLRVVNKKGEPITGTATTSLSESELKEIQDVILGGARKEEIDNLLSKAKLDARQ